jgi:2-polyprenyl-3-methyl-5-hydroxy-6-metoxy-1,4-benzoquinol methylase
MGKVNWNDKTFEYVQCASCGSLYCEPMPNEADLARLYGQEYQDEFYATSTPASVRSNPAVRWLKKHRPATFLDYGCGSGALLGAAAALDWKIMGVEFDDEVAQLVAEKTKGNVVSDPTLLQEGTADVLHLGDVLEHLTRMNEQMPTY